MLTVEQHMKAQAFRDAIGQRDCWHEDRGPVWMGVDFAKPQTRKELAAQRKIQKRIKKRNKRYSA